MPNRLIIPPERDDTLEFNLSVKLTVLITRLISAVLLFKSIFFKLAIISIISLTLKSLYIPNNCGRYPIYSRYFLSLLISFSL